MAFANNPRGYKMLPHFQIGLWNKHLFVWFAVIYEAPQKEVMGERFIKKAAKIKKEIPKEFSWSLDHTKPDTIKHEQLTKADFLAQFERLKTIKKAELLCGYTIDREQVVNLGAAGLLTQIEDVFYKVAPLYKIAQNIK